jgi:hypothetical protein
MTISGKYPEDLGQSLGQNLEQNLGAGSRELIHQACHDVEGLRQWVAANLGVATGDFDLWLPIALTGKGSLYAEVIGRDAQSPSGYKQPIDLSDQERQPLYKLGFDLLHHLEAPPAVYLMQFGFVPKNSGEAEREVGFDRLFPFPAAPAVASLGIQEPDLFTCHWHCLTGTPLRDILILEKNLTV